jgi:predicted phosphodiesterase
MSNVLVIGDIHAPAEHPAYLQFCKDIYRKHKCDTVVFIGDVVDWHAISFHAANPECPGPVDEYELALEHIQRWYKAFPKAYVCIGNHDERILRLAESVSIPSKFIRDFNETWKTPKWVWAYEHCIDDVCYFHGTGANGLHPAYNMVKQRLISVVMGHCHSAGGIKWLVNPYRRVFGMDVGTGIDVRAYQFAYGKHTVRKPMVSCGVVLDGMPYHEPMPCSDGEPYDRVRFEGSEKQIDEISLAPSTAGQATMEAQRLQEAGDFLEQLLRRRREAWENLPNIMGRLIPKSLPLRDKKGRFVKKKKGWFRKK